MVNTDVLDATEVPALFDAVTATAYVVAYFKVGSTQVFGRMVSQSTAPLTLTVYLLIGAPPSKVDAPHETVSSLIASAVALKRLGAPGATTGVCIAFAVLASVAPWALSVTVTMRNSYAVAPSPVGDGLGEGDAETSGAAAMRTDAARTPTRRTPAAIGAEVGAPAALGVGDELTDGDGEGEGGAT